MQLAPPTETIPFQPLQPIGTQLTNTKAGADHGVYHDSLNKTLITTDLGTEYASFAQALAAAKQLSAGAKPGVALIQAGAGWTLFNAAVVSQKTTAGITGTRGAGFWSASTPTVTALDAASFTAADLVHGTHDETLAIVDGEVVLHAEHDGTRLPPHFVPGPPKAAA